jgi:predicted alpha/beta-hydrolase family hydrolase
MGGVSEGLKSSGTASMRFNFPYQERGSRSPDKPDVAVGTWLAATALAAEETGLKVWAGGKSFGGRMASMAVAEGMAAEGLIFFGYPLHPPGKPERLRDQHLYDISVPMLFIQGTADPFARLDLLERVVDTVGAKATLHLVEEGDHSFRVKGRRRSTDEIASELGELAGAFIKKRSGRNRRR